MAYKSILQMPLDVITLLLMALKTLESGSLLAYLQDFCSSSPQSLVVVIVLLMRRMRRKKRDVLMQQAAEGLSDNYAYILQTCR